MNTYLRAKDLLRTDCTTGLIQVATLIRQAIDADQVLVLKPLSRRGDRLDIIWSDPDTVSSARQIGSRKSNNDYLLPVDSIRGVAETQLKNRKSVIHYFNKGYLWSGHDVGKDYVEAIRLELVMETDPLIYLWIRKAENLFTDKCRKDFEGLMNVLRSKGIKNMSSHELSHRSSDSKSRLSPTENRVMGFLLQGLTEREISKEMDRSPNTIHVHVRNIYRKYLVHSRAELFEQARRSEMKIQ